MSQFSTLKRLYSLPLLVIRFIIHNLLPASGLVFIVGKPKSGKSTLARQLILAVAKGVPFFGCDTVQCSVLYYAIEERTGEVIRHFRNMGANGDEPIEIHTGALATGWLLDLEDRLTKNPLIKMVVIDPLLLAAHVKDANDYAQMMKALSPLREVARRFEVAIVCVHHSKKSVSADPGDNVLGSTAVRGSADATWQVIKQPDGQRTFQTEMRYGTDMSPMNLIFDENSGLSQLGQAEAFVEKQKAAVTRDRIERSIIDAVTEIPMRTREEIIDAVVGNSAVKHEMFGKLERYGVLVKSGNGVKGDPHRYVVAVPVEAEQHEEEFVEA